ncbi:cyclic GMP-AMP synthase [Leptodactylus fuscus]|uniref:cyclic GMP-AMP synthase-like n=1 Tax=Leptodactylus fuscus TaxID=238119 RepID=UPI003F4F1C50
MEGREQPVQDKEMATRPKEPRARGRSPHNSGQLGNGETLPLKRDLENPGNYTSEVDNRCDGPSSGRNSQQKEPRGRGRSPHNSGLSGNGETLPVKRDLEKPGNYTSFEVDNRCDGHSSGRKSQQKEPKSKKNPTDGPIERNHQRLQDTSAKEGEDKGKSPEHKDKIAQLTANVRYLPVGLHSATTTEKKLSKSKSMDLETNNRAEDQSSINKKKIDKQQKVRHVKCKSLDDTQENGQPQTKVASEKKVCSKTTKEEDIKTVSSRAPRRLKDVIDRKLKLKMEEISNATQKVNAIVNTVLKSDQFSYDPLFKNTEKLTTGSYYERVKISKPNEFDIMLKVQPPTLKTIHMENLDGKGPFYTLSFKGRMPQDMLKYLDSEGNILARKIVKEFIDLIKDVIAKTGMKGVSVQRKDPGSPAVTLIIKHEPQGISVDLVLALTINSWPEETTGGMNIDDWLGTKVKQEYKKSYINMVPKQAMIGNEEVNKDTWRISFSHIEKKMLNNHGNGKTCCETGGSKKEMCCRKQCLKLLKHLLELLKKNGKPRKMDNFCSYHAKTALLHQCALHPKDEDWKLEDLEFCFDRYVSFFQECLSRQILYNFFIPSHNLFDKEFVKKSNCDYLCKQIEEQKCNNYPIFYD